MIYFIRNEETQRVKIGFTKENDGIGHWLRLFACETGNDCPLRMLGVMDGDAKTDRKLRLNVFVKFHVRRDWFEGANELLAFIEQHSRYPGVDPREQRRREKRERNKAPEGFLTEKQAAYTLALSVTQLRTINKDEWRTSRILHVAKFHPITDMPLYRIQEIERWIKARTIHPKELPDTGKELIQGVVK